MYVGLDLSLRATGCAALDSQNLANCAVTTISPPDSYRDGKRLAAIHHIVQATLNGLNISGVAIEGYSFGSRNNQFQLGEVGGIVRLWLTHRDIPYIVVPPNVLKKWTTGSGTADKIAMAVATFDQWGLKFDDDNQCDAFNLAVLAACYNGDEMVKMTADRKKILADIRANPLALPKKRTK